MYEILVGFKIWDLVVVNIDGCDGVSHKTNSAKTGFIYRITKEVKKLGGTILNIRSFG